MRPEIEYPKPASVWRTIKLHADSVDASMAKRIPGTPTGSAYIEWKVRPSLILKYGGIRNDMRIYLSVYLTHEGSYGSGSERLDVIDCGNLIDDSRSFAETPPVSLPENLLTEKVKDIEQEVFNSIKKKVQVSLMRI